MTDKKYDFGDEEEYKQLQSGSSSSGSSSEQSSYVSFFLYQSNQLTLNDRIVRPIKSRLINLQGLFLSILRLDYIIKLKKSYD